MAQKKGYRSDNTYMISTDTGDNPKLGAKVLSDGRESLFLDYYLGYTKSISEKSGKEIMKVNRKRGYLSLYLWQAPRTPIERQQNKETLELAKKIRFEREQELKSGMLGYRLQARNINFYNYMEEYYNSYKKADVRMVKAVFTRFKSFIKNEYPVFANSIPPKKLTVDMMEHFLEYNQELSTGDGAISHWKRWKRFIKVAYQSGYIDRNLCEGVICRIDRNKISKEILSLDEVKQLLQTSYKGQNTEIRRAFAFTLYTGIRFCDIKHLTYEAVDYANKRLCFNQRKVEGHSSKSYVEIPLSKTLLNLIGEEPEQRHRKDLIFKLPSHTSCLKGLRVWTEKAGIKKHITWHCGRHSFAVNILNNGANIKTVSSLLGHSSLQMTEKYIHAIDKLKEEAINSLPELDI